MRRISLTDRLAARIGNVTLFGRRVGDVTAEARRRTVPRHWTNLFGVVTLACIVVVTVHRPGADVLLHALERRDHVHRRIRSAARRGGLEGVRVDDGDHVRPAGRTAAAAGAPLGGAAAARVDHHAAAHHVLHGRLPAAAACHVGAALPDLRRQPRRRLERLRPARRHALGHRPADHGGHRARHPGRRHLAGVPALRRVVPGRGHRAPVPAARRGHSGAAHRARRDPRARGVAARAAAVPGPRPHRGADRGRPDAARRGRPRRRAVRDRHRACCCSSRRRSR